MQNKSQTINKRTNPFLGYAFVSADPESCQKSRKAVNTPTERADMDQWPWPGAQDNELVRGVVRGGCNNAMEAKVNRIQGEKGAQFSSRRKTEME